MKQVLLWAILLLFVSFGCQTAPGGGLDVIFFDVGKADCAYVYCGESLLVDAGTAKDGVEVAQDLLHMGTDSIDMLLITHFDKDHVGGAAEIMEQFGVKTLIRPAYMKESDEAAACMETAERLGIEVITVSEKSEINIGEAKLVIYPPEQEYYEKNQSNNSSLVAELIYGETNMLFTGDAQKERIEEIGKILNPEGYDLLKVPYHGNYMNCLPEFFEKTGAQYGVVTSSSKNPEDAKTVEAMKAAGIKPLFTRNGMIMCHSNGEMLTVKQ